MTIEPSDFLFACRAGDFEEVKETKAYIKEKDDHGNTGLHFASANGYLEIVQYLIQNGAELNLVNDTENTCLHWAALNGHLNIVTLLLENGADPQLKNSSGRSAATLAEQQGHHDCVNKIWTMMKEDQDEEDDEAEFINDGIKQVESTEEKRQILDFEPSLEE